MASGQVQLISGVEISCRWGASNIHIVGLNFDSANAKLLAFLFEQQQLRVRRNGRIVEKLKKLANEELAADLDKLYEASPSLGRPDIAKLLVKHGAAKDMRQAFSKYLADGKSASASINWPSIETVVAIICEAGGEAVLAHPMHYKMTGSKRRALLADFKAAGGSAMEVISGRQDAQRTKELAKLAGQFKLKASIGSDFHSESMQWQRLGCPAELPKACEAVWHDWELKV